MVQVYVATTNSDHFFLAHCVDTNEKSRDNLYRDPFLWSAIMAPLHSGSYQDCTTRLYFVDMMSIYKIRLSGAVLVAS